MASKQGLKIFDLRNSLRSVYLKMGDFLKYKLWMRRKQLLLIGERQHPVIRRVSRELVDGWRVTVLERERGENRNEQMGVEYCQIEHYQKVEQRLSKRVFNSIIVIPPNPSLSEKMDFQNQNIVTTFIQAHQSILMDSVLTYRLAHQLLAKTGVIILSSGQKDFLDYKWAKRQQEEAQLMHQSYPTAGNSSLLGELVGSQVAAMSVGIGERDYTDLNSKCVISLSNQLYAQHLDLVVERYLQWAKGDGLPTAGSFALFKPPFAKSKQGYVQYL